MEDGGRLSESHGGTSHDGRPHIMPSIGEYPNYIKASLVHANNSAQPKNAPHNLRDLSLVRLKSPTPVVSTALGFVNAYRTQTLITGFVLGEILRKTSAKLCLRGCLFQSGADGSQGRRKAYNQGRELPDAKSPTSYSLARYYN